jgi:hypothetical protein
MSTRPVTRQKVRGLGVSSCHPHRYGLWQFAHWRLSNFAPIAPCCAGSKEKMQENNLVILLKEAFDDGARFGFKAATSIVRCHLNALQDPVVSAAVSADRLAARIEQVEKILESLSQQELKL